MPLARRAALAAIALLLPGKATAAQTPPVRTRGTLVAIDGDVLTMTTTAGQTIKVTLTPDASVTAVVPAKIGDVKAGSFVGAAAVPGPKGALVAFEIHIFPEEMRGVGAGHFPFDLQPDSTMTNGTVGSVAFADGQMITVVGYEGGEQTILVPPDIPVVGFAPGDRALLTKGAHAILFVKKQANGGLTAGRILVGKDGLVPPM